MPVPPKIPRLKPMLVLRKQAGDMLGCSTNKLKELERQGLLTPIKLTGPLGITHYRLSEIEALVEGEAA